MTPEEASRVLAAGGVRLMQLDTSGVPTIGIWSDLDTREVRVALWVFGNTDCPVLYLDGPGVPARYKLRCVPGDPVPLNVLEAIMTDTRAQAAPWKVRDEILARMRYHQRPKSFPASI